MLCAWGLPQQGFRRGVQECTYGTDLYSIHAPIKGVEAQLDLAEGAAAERLNHHVLVDARGARDVARVLQGARLLGQARDARGAGLQPPGEEMQWGT